jgi:DNA repair protein RecO
MGTDEIIVKGIVLDAFPQNEYDKRIVLLTSELGRVTVFVNSARRPGNRFTAVCQKFVMADMTLRQGRNSYTLVKASIIRPFIELSADIEVMCYASYMCELTGYFTREGLGAADELNLLYLTFNELLKNRLKYRLIRSIFECKLLDIEGIGLQTDVYKKQGGNISSTAEYTIQYILSREISDVYTFDLKPEAEEELSRIIFAYTEKHCDRHFKSLDILSSLM